MCALEDHCEAAGNSVQTPSVTACSGVTSQKSGFITRTLSGQSIIYTLVKSRAGKSHSARIIISVLQALINSTITANMNFTKTSPKFGQWSDHRANTVYGLGFSSEGDLLQVYSICCGYGG